jgi:hypothetical protein
VETDPFLLTGIYDAEVRGRSVIVYYIFLIPLLVPTCDLPTYLEPSYRHRNLQGGIDALIVRDKYERVDVEHVGGRRCGRGRLARSCHGRSSVRTQFS